MRGFKTFATAGSLALLAASPVLAHAGHDHSATLAAGLMHPVAGWDHLLAMLGVGVLAAQQTGAARFALPAGFVGGVLAGALAALAGVLAPYVEFAILGTVAIIAALVIVRAQFGVLAGLVLALGFGLAHGYAHGVEAPGGHLTDYIAGFTLSTAALHAAGAGLALMATAALRRSRSAAAA